MEKNKLSRYLIFISVFTALSVFVFIVQKSYSNLMKPISEAKTSSLTKPIDSNLDVTVLDQIEQRLEYSAPTLSP